MSTTPTGWTPMGWTVEARVHFGTAARGRKRLVAGEAAPPAPVEPGSVPRVARLLALAHRFDGFLRSGAVADQAELARLAGVSRPRLTQIMNLLLLAPDIQEAVLDLPRTVAGCDGVTERDLRPIAAKAEWGRQREAWRRLQGRA